MVSHLIWREDPALIRSLIIMAAVVQLHGVGLSKLKIKKACVLNIELDGSAPRYVATHQVMYFESTAR